MKKEPILDNGLTSERLNEHLKRMTEKCVESANKPDLFPTKCKKCGQKVYAAYYPVEECPMCESSPSGKEGK